MPLFTMQMSEAEHAQLKAAAAKAGVSMAAWIRKHALFPMLTVETRTDPVIAGLDDASREAARLIAIGPLDVAAQLAARGIDVPQAEHVVLRRNKIVPPKMHKHQAAGNGPVPVCTCGAVRSSDGFWHIVPT